MPAARPDIRGFQNDMPTAGASGTACPRRHAAPGPARQPGHQPGAGRPRLHVGRADRHEQRAGRGVAHPGGGRRARRRTGDAGPGRGGADRGRPPGRRSVRDHHARPHGSCRSARRRGRRGRSPHPDRTARRLARLMRRLLRWTLPGPARPGPRRAAVLAEFTMAADGRAHQRTGCASPRPASRPGARPGCWP